MGAQVLGDQWQFTERFTRYLEEFAARPFYPAAMLGRGRRKGNFPISLEAAEMIKSNHIDHVEHGAEAIEPPIEAPSFQHIPGVDRVAVANQLEQARLAKLLRRSRDGVQLVEAIDGATVFEHACRLGLEGIVSKRRDSVYRPGRSRMWLKVKNPDSPAMQRVWEEDR